jgi:Flp pilus assembly protein TadG
MNRRPARKDTRERGAAAVEFALLLPLLLLIIFGTIDFGRALNAQITLTQAAREGARLASIGDSYAAVQTGTQGAATGLSSVVVPPPPKFTACTAGAGPGVNAVVNVTYSFSFITPVAFFASMFGSSFGSAITLSAQGVMPCET